MAASTKKLTSIFSTSISVASSVPSLQLLAGIEFLKQANHVNEIKNVLKENEYPLSEMHSLNAILTLLATQLNLLLSYVVGGKQTEAESLLNNKNYVWLLPLLLTYKGNVTDHTGHHYDDVTALQAALRTQDVEMCKMLKTFFDRLSAGQEIMAAQFFEEFPDGVALQKPSFDFSSIIKALEQAARDGVDLRNPISDLGFDENGTPLAQALKTFKENFTAFVQKEKQFNPQHLIRAYRICQENFNRWGWRNPSQDVYNVFSNRVVGFIQRFLPACYGQAFFDIWDISDGKKSFNRDRNILLGENSYKYLGVPQAMPTKHRFCAIENCTAIPLEKYVAQKERELKALCVPKIENKLG